MYCIGIFFDFIDLIYFYNKTLQHCKHRGKSDDWPMMSRPKGVSKDSIICYQDLLEYVDLQNIEQGFHGEPALKKQ